MQAEAGCMAHIRRISRGVHDVNQLLDHGNVILHKAKTGHLLNRKRPTHDAHVLVHTHVDQMFDLSC